MYIHVYGGVFVKIERNWDTSPLVLLDTIHGQQHILHDGKERVRCKPPPQTQGLKHANIPYIRTSPQCSPVSVKGCPAQWVKSLHLGLRPLSCKESPGSKPYNCSVAQHMCYLLKYPIFVLRSHS